MNNSELTNILIEKWKQNELAHFYIVDSQSDNSSWPLDFISEVFRQEKGLRPNESVNESLTKGHPDLLFIGQWFQESEKLESENNKSNQTPYKVEDFREFFQFMEFSKFEFKRKFALIKNAQNIGGRELANKLLKTLESPGQNTTIFFEVSAGSFFLPTIESRAIRLRSLVPKAQIDESSGITESTSFQAWPKLLKLEGPVHDYATEKISFIELAEKTRFDSQLQSHLTTLLLDWAGQNNSSFQDKKSLLERIQYFKKSKTFYNSADERFLALLGVEAYHSTT